MIEFWKKKENKICGNKRIRIKGLREYWESNVRWKL